MALKKPGMISCPPRCSRSYIVTRDLLTEEEHLPKDQSFLLRVSELRCMKRITRDWCVNGVSVIHDLLLESEKFYEYSQREEMFR